MGSGTHQNGNKGDGTSVSFSTVCDDSYYGSTRVGYLGSVGSTLAGSGGTVEYYSSASLDDSVRIYNNSVYPTPQKQETPKKGRPSLIKELFGDLRQYIRENRDLIFSIVFVLVLDEYVFDGAFRERLKSVIEGVLKKVERKTGIDIPGIEP